uniref:Cupin type-1 domain-containing protein n=1 Tax=Tanacetum cinerariifolium TaxID=118510 RepID=A0A6L2MJF8_TANCI|nr:hypothetical protein [Tanacetum cinerariifolium]
MTSRGLLLATCSLVALASDPSPLQDFCVADRNSKVLVNGFVCKDPKMVKAEDFLFRGLDKMGNTTNPVGSNVTAVNVNQLPGLNTLGISMVRIDYAPWVAIAALSSQNPGVITIADAVFGSNPDISDDILARAFQVDKKESLTHLENVQVEFPTLLYEFLASFSSKAQNEQFLVTCDHLALGCVAIAGLSSQNPGVITIADAVFGSNPDISDDILAKAFQVDKKKLGTRIAGLETQLEHAQGELKIPKDQVMDTGQKNGYLDFPILLDLQAITLEEHNKDSTMLRKTDGSLYKRDSDSHSHLYFECEYSKVFWGKALEKMGVFGSTYKWNDLLIKMSRIYNGNLVNGIIRRLCFAESVYLIWQKGSNRIFTDESRSTEEMIKALIEIVRIRLFSLKFKRSVAVKKAQEMWDVKLCIVDTLKGVLGKAVLKTDSYSSNRIFTDESRSTEEMIKVLIDIVRIRLFSLKFKRSVAVKKAQERWDVKLCIVDTLKGVFGKAVPKTDSYSRMGYCPSEAYIIATKSKE